MALIEHQIPIKPHDMKIFPGDHELAVNQSIQSLLDSLQNRNPNLSVFTSTFLDLMQANPNPLFESIWVFSSLTFRINNSSKIDLSDRLSSVKDLFQSIKACSVSCSSSICVALTAPVIFELYKIVVDLKRGDMDLKKGKKVRKEIRSFVDVVLGYFNVCSDGLKEDSGLIRPLVDLVSIWVHGEGIDNEGGKNGLNQFFPLLNDEIIDWIHEEYGGVLEVVAGGVIMEAFLLKLCLKFDEGSSRLELWNELRTWAVCSVTGFCNFYTFDLLVKMLLEPTLPVTSLLSSEDESFLRKILCDIVILPDYSFLNPDKLAHIPNTHVKNDIFARLMVTHEAIQLFRKTGDRAKAVLYTNAFSGSHLPTLLIKLVTSELGTPGIASLPNGSSPTTFLKWILDLETQGLKLSDGFVPKHKARLAHYTSNPDLDPPSYILNSKKKDDDLLFFIDNKGNEKEEETDNDFMNKSFVSAALEMKSDKDSSGKKRKETSGGKKKDRVKFRRFNVLDRLGSSGSEVEDPDSDEDTE